MVKAWHGSLLLAASRAITAALAKMKLAVTVWYTKVRHRKQRYEPARIRPTVMRRGFEYPKL